MKTHKPQKEYGIREACRKYLDGEASLDYLLSFIIKKRLITK